MELFKGQSLLEFTERFKTDLDCEEYLIPSSQRFFTHLQYLWRYGKSYCWGKDFCVNDKDHLIFRKIVFNTNYYGYIIF